MHDVNITLGLRNSFMVEWRDSDDGDDDKTQNRTASDPDAYAGLYLDLPVLSTKITALESVDADCNPLDNTNLDATNKSSILKALNKPYSIEPFAKMEFGVKVAVRKIRLLLMNYSKDEQRLTANPGPRNR